jgi:integrase/recombinase XerD
MPRMHPHMLRPTFVTTGPDADRAGKNLDRHPNDILAAHMASRTEPNPHGSGR